MDTTDLPLIHNDQDWLDLRVGEKAILRGKLKLKHGDTSILVEQPDWSDTFVYLTDEGGADTKGIFYNTSNVKIVVERTEDGLSTSVKDIAFIG